MILNNLSTSLYSSRIDQEYFGDLFSFFGIGSPARKSAWYNRAGDLLLSQQDLAPFANPGVDWLGLGYESHSLRHVEFLHPDRLGSTTMLTNWKGSVKNQYRYDAFGQPIFQRPYGLRHQSKFLFNGQEWDHDAQLVHFFARDYDPDTGRFLTVDPYKGTAYLPSAGHAYGFPGNNPLSHPEFKGLGAKKWFKEKVGKPLSDAADWTYDYVVNPVANTAVTVVGGGFVLANLTAASAFFAVRDLGPLVFEGEWEPFVGDLITPLVMLGYGTYRASKGGEWWGVEFVKGEQQAFDWMQSWLDGETEPGAWADDVRKYARNKYSSLTQSVRNVQNQARSAQQAAIEGRVRLEANMWCSGPTNLQPFMIAHGGDSQAAYNDCVAQRVNQQGARAGSKAPGRGQAATNYK